MPRFRAGTQANGLPTIDVEPYVYSREGMEALVAEVAALGACAPATYITDGLGSFAGDFTFDGTAVTIHMDNWGFTFAFEDLATRDRVLALLLAREERR